MVHLFPFSSWLVGAGALMAAVTDLLYRKIPNRLSLSLLILWLLTLGIMGLEGKLLPIPESIRLGTLYAVGSLAIGFALFCFHLVGAGDVKLASVLCLWLGGNSLDFLIFTSLAGGVLILQLPLLRRIEVILAHCAFRLSIKIGHPLLETPVALRETALKGLPYGPAIAMGVAISLFRMWF